jgi:L-cystine transport system substrate-binding protein
MSSTAFMVKLCKAVVAYTAARVYIQTLLKNAILCDNASTVENSGGVKMKAVFGMTALALILGGFTGCKKNADEASVRTVNVVTVTSNAPFSYVNKDGEYDGYEIAVLKEINKKLPRYKFKLDAMDFSALSFTLEAETASIAAGTFVRSEARRAKFLFPSQYTALMPINLAVRADRPNVNSLTDLAGMTVASVVSRYEHSFLLTWNKTHPNKKLILKAYEEANDDFLLKTISSGKIDSALMSPAAYNAVIKEQEIPNLRLTPPVFIEDFYFMLAKNERTLCEDLDYAIESLRQDGTLSRLSEQYLDVDMFAQYTTQFEAQKTIIQ